MMTTIDDFTDNASAVFKEEDTNVLNELFLLKSSAASSNRKFTALMTLVLALLLSTMGISIGALKHAKGGVIVDEGSTRLMTKSGATASAVSLGENFQLPVFTIHPWMMSDDSNTTTQVFPHPYVCVGVETASRLWTSVMFGIHTNAIVIMAKEGQVLTDENVEQYGVTFTYQGMKQNKTHSCLYTIGEDMLVCLNFVNPRCGGTEKIHSITDSKFNRRQLFEEVVYPKSPFDDRHLSFQEGDECPYGHWCDDFAAIELVGSGW